MHEKHRTLALPVWGAQEEASFVGRITYPSLLSNNLIKRSILAEPRSLWPHPREAGGMPAFSLCHDCRGIGGCAGGWRGRRAGKWCPRRAALGGACQACLSPPWAVLGPEGQGGLQCMAGGGGEGSRHHAVLPQIHPMAWIREGGTSPPCPHWPCPWHAAVALGDHGLGMASRWFL